MFQFISIVIGLICAFPMVLGLIPMFGWVQWIVLVGCVVGIIFGSFCKKKIGLVINIAVALVAALRLLLGGGAF
jgi:hypothetical protein